MDMQNGAEKGAEKWTCIFVLSVKPIAALKLLEQYGCPNTCAPNMIFLYLHSAKTKITIPN